MARLRVRNPAKVTPFGARIQEIREANGLSQEEFGARIGVAQNVVSRWETGERKGITMRVAIRIADAFGLSLDTVLARAPFRKDADPFPGRALLVQTPEFRAAPEAARERILAVYEASRASWSVVRWTLQLVIYTHLSGSLDLFGISDPDSLKSVEAATSELKDKPPSK